MANASAAGTVWNCPNYIGELFLIGAQNGKLPFLTMVGDATQGTPRLKLVKSFQHPVAQPWSLEAAAQPAITETTSLTAPTPVTYVRGQDTNTVQIFQKQVSLSYAKESVTGEISGLSILGEQPVMDEKEFQKMAVLKQIAKDYEYSMLNGAYQAATAANVAAKMRGIITATTTNAVAAGGAALSSTLINQLLRTMVGNGAIIEQAVVWVNALQKQRFSSIYGYAPEDRNIGGLNINQVETDFGRLGIVYCANIPTDTMLIGEMSVVYPVALPVPRKGVIFYEDLSKAGAAEPGQFYGQLGVDYGPEEYHGKITGLATS